MVKRVKVYQPDIRVMLYKTISRKTLDGQKPVSARFQGTARKIDLSPFLSDSMGLRTSKSIREAAGGFSITLADKPYKAAGSFETLYGIVEPMDIVEIRMRHNPPTSTGGQPPIIMRGFVSDVQRSETMGADGRPQRSLVVSGQDYGKLWQMLQILYLPGYVIGEDIISSFKLFERFGYGFQTAMTGKQFVQDTIEKVLNPYLDTLMPKNSPDPTAPRAVKLDISVQHGMTSVTGPQNQQGTIYNLLHDFCDVGIWNELYIEDREDGVYCVFRPNPAMDVNGKLIQSDAPAPVYVDLPDVDVISLSVSRSDANVANYYWVRGPRFEMVSDIYRQQFAIQSAEKETVLLDKYPNSAVNLYGIRVMYADTQMGGDDVTNFGSGLPAAAQAKRDTSVANWLDDRRRIMVEQNKDNILFERGMMRVRGNENIKPGVYVRLRRGSFTASYYVVQVDHDYVPFVGFFSTLTVERGTGFIERVKRGGGSDSPYLAEMTATPSIGSLLSTNG